MVKRLLGLIKSAFKAYNEGGHTLLFKRTSSYLNDFLLFNKYSPPICLNYKDMKYSLGYKSKYIYTDSRPKVVPSKLDTVVEAGVYRGRDTVMYAKLAKNVFGFEPSPRNFRDAKENLDEFDNITLINEGLWKEKSELEINYGESGDDDGFLKPDSDSGEKGDRIPVNTLEKYAEQLNIDKIDFLKIEAEGAEPEIIEGIGDLHIENIVINAGEERDGEPTGKEVMELLQPTGYNLVGIKNGHILFFTLDSVGHFAFRPEFS